jgi:tol-pal system protein YbgF
MHAPLAEPVRGPPHNRIGGGIAPALALALGLLVSGCATTRPEDDPVQVKLNDVDARLTRIERIISNQSLVDLAQRLDSVQADLRQLRGRIEEIEYKQEALRKQQKDFYNDLDKRVGGGGASGAGANGSAGGTSGGAGVGATAAAVMGALAGSAASGGSGGGSATGATGSNSGSATGSADTGGGASSEEQTVYSQSFDALKAGSYSVAITGFKDFLKSYPGSPLAENAQYWLGEAYYVTHDLDDASSAFRNVVQKWPNSRKTPDALLKLGYTQLDQKKTSEGRATLSQVAQKYPGTDAARLASERLQRAGKQ